MALTSKAIAIVQSNYIPWKGYFDLINSVDEFVLYDDMQYTRRDWRNRNKIKTPHGLQWLTIPVDVKGRYLQRINETRVSNRAWAATHWKTIAHNYARARHFAHWRAAVEKLYDKAGSLTMLSEINHLLLVGICDLLEIRTAIRTSSEFRLVEGKTERLLGICEQAGATTYVSGPAAREYMDEAAFAKAGVELRWFDYAGYPEYEQLFPPFEHGVTVLDLMFNVGPAARQHLKSATSRLWI